MPADIVLGRILPGLALATCFGNFWYAYEAYRLAHKEKRQDVTAQPYGVGAGAVFGWLFLIIGPVFWDTGDAVLAWRVGLAACFLGGVVEILGAVAGKKIIRITPRAALLGNLAAGAIVWLSLVSILEIFSNPLVAVLPMFIVLIAFLGKVKMPFGMPAGLFAILVGTIIAWGTGSMDMTAVTASVNGIGFYMPTLSIGDVFAGLGSIVKYLPIIIPLQVANFLTTLQGLESASAAGDDYPVRMSMTMDGVGTILGSFFGNPFPTTVYYGHPSWKEVGARSGYSILNGVAYLVLGLTGAVGLISAVIPYQVVMSMLLFVGLVVGAQAFNECNKKHGVAILFGFLPLIAQYLETAVNESLAAMGGNMASVGVEAFSSSFPIRGVLALSQGAFLSSLLLTAIIAFIIDAKFKQAGYFAIFSAACAFMGLIHAPIMQWMAPSGAPFAAVYMTVALSCFYVEWKKEKLVDPAHLDLSSVDSVDNEQATA
jgi:AGZA family xanthine/uracil permease-like MFS transporter